MKGITPYPPSDRSTAMSKSWHREDSRKSSIPPNSGKADMYNYSRVGRNDTSLVPPIRQTASIFKQPVTVHKTQKSTVKHDVKYGSRDKPKQFFWEKRLEGLSPCNTHGQELKSMDLPTGLTAVGPDVTRETLLQSVATALHVSSVPVIGQKKFEPNSDKDSWVFLNRDQPLIEAVTIVEDDIRKQEERVINARRKLQEAVKCLS